MALFSASQMRAIDARQSPSRIHHRVQAELLEKLASESSRPTVSHVVFIGVVRAVEFALLVITGLLLFHLHVVDPVEQMAVYYPVTFAVSIMAVVVFQTLRAYSVPAFRRPVRQGFRMAGGWGALFLTILAFVFFFKLDVHFSRVWVISWFHVGLLTLVIERFILARLVADLARSGRLERRAVVVGGGDHARELLIELKKADPAEVRLIGVFDDRSDDRAPETIEGFAKLGNVDELVEFARAARIDLAIFALPISAEKRILEMLRKLWVLPIDVRLAAHANRLRFRPRSYSYVGTAPMLDVFDTPLADWDIVMKLVFDKVVGALALLLLSPVFLATAIAIKLDSRGPVFFKQKRYGFNNELVEVYKFRSMYADKLDVTASRLVTRDDPRVTRVGRFIRKTSIDELPQLFNVVFKGDLSLVGPRPHAIHAKAADRQYDEVVDGYFARHRVKPGITGWAQVHGWRGETDTQEKIQNRVDHDLYYIENWSILLDIYILAITPVSLVKTNNAY